MCATYLGYENFSVSSNFSRFLYTIIIHLLFSDLLHFCSGGSISIRCSTSHSGDLITSRSFSNIPIVTKYFSNCLKGEGKGEGIPVLVLIGDIELPSNLNCNPMVGSHCGEGGQSWMSLKKEEASVPQRRLSCTTHFDALWFCYSPVHQMQQYYRLGALDNCSGKWTALVDCLNLKTKRSSEVEEIIETREKAKPHIWSFRSPEEAASHWKELFGQLDEQD